MIRQRYFFAFLLLFLTLFTACTRGEQMRNRLLFVSDCNRADTVFTELWLPTVDSLTDFFQSRGTANERMMAYYLKGRVLHDIGKMPQALDAYQYAIVQADTTREDCDLYTLYAVYGQMAELFEAQYLPDDEIKALKNSERIAWKDHDTLSAIAALGLRSSPYYLQGKKDSVILIEKQARELYLKHGQREKAAQAISGTISVLLDRQKYEEASRYIRIFKQESGWFDAEGNAIAGKEGCYYDIGRYLLAVGQVDSALLCFQKMLNKGQNEFCYHGLLSVYKKKNIPDSIAKYSELFADANDSSYLYVNQEKVHRISAMYDYNRYLQKAEEAEEKVRNRNNIIWGFLFIVFFILITGYLRYSRGQKAKNALIKRLIADYRLARDYSRHMKQEMTELEDLKNTNEKMVKEKQRKINELNLIVQQYEEQLDTLKVEAKIKTLKKSAIVEKFNQKKQYKPDYLMPTNHDWTLLKAAFVQSVPEFVSFINSKKRLSEQEKRICMLECLDFSAGEMSMALNITSQAVTNAKTRANQKLFSQNSASTLGENLKEFKLE